MALFRTVHRRIFTATVAIWLACQLHAQVTSRDTADYLPEDRVENALDYNLMVAASKGLETEVERLILRGAEIDAESIEGATPLIFAISGIKPKAVEILLSYNANPNKLTVNKETPLIIALRKLMDVESKGSNTLTAMYTEGCLQIAESLIRYGADIDFQDNRGVTALNYASAYGSMSFVDLLLYYRADINKKDLAGTTPLMSAIWAGNANVADLLIQNGANLEARDNDGFSPFLIAAQNGDTLMLHYLIKEGVDMYEKCREGWDALSLCIKYDHRDAIAMLIKAGNKWSDPDMNALNHYNVAAKYGRSKVIELLESSNFPNTYKAKISQMEVALSAKFNTKDLYTGFKFVFTEPRQNIGFLAGFDSKLWYSKVILRKEDNLFFHYMDKSSVAYAGVFKNFKISDNPFKSNLYFSASLSGGYWFGNKFKGTETSPESKFRLMPAAGLKWMKKSFSLYAEIEYMNTGYYKSLPIWLRTGLSYNFDFELGKTPVKLIRWY
jgi:ankyrin repeat protein